MGLLDNQKLKIQQEYTKIWDVVQKLYDLSGNNWDEVGQFLGHHDFDTKLQLYRVDSHLKINLVNFDFEPIRNLINTLSMMWLEQDDEELKNLRFKLYSYYWNSFDLDIFEPLKNIGFNNDNPLQKTIPKISKAPKPITPLNGSSIIPTQKRDQAVKDSIGCGQPSVQQLEPNIENLNTEIMRLKGVVMDKTKNIEKLQERIAELEVKEMQFHSSRNAINNDEINLINNDLIFVAALVKMLSNEKRAYTQSKILEMIEDANNGITGLSKSRTEKVMAVANKLYKPLIKNKMK
ncbi:hypothetical protein [Acinetobacter puyangensis]|uniref:hypothetical protein n=1 Tax=Acinetobacter puyangensis TaxID=1096779 RepID=UPI003A4D4E64